MPSTMTSFKTVHTQNIVCFWGVIFPPNILSFGSYFHREIYHAIFHSHKMME